MSSAAATMDFTVAGQYGAMLEPYSHAERKRKSCLLTLYFLPGTKLSYEAECMQTDIHIARLMGFICSNDTFL